MGRNTYRASYLDSAVDDQMCLARGVKNDIIQLCKLGLERNVVNTEAYWYYIKDGIPGNGAPNLIDHFNQKSYLQLNLNDYGDSLKKINQIINSDEYEKSYDHLIQAKETVLEKFNIIKRIDNIIENLEDENATKYEIKRIYNKRYFESNSKTSKLAYSFDKRLLKLSNKLKDKYT